LWGLCSGLTELTDHDKIDADPDVTELGVAVSTTVLGVPDHDAFITDGRANATTKLKTPKNPIIVLFINIYYANL